MHMRRLCVIQPLVHIVSSVCLLAVGLCLFNRNSYLCSGFFVCFSCGVRRYFRILGACLLILIPTSPPLALQTRNHNIVKMDNARQERTKAKAEADKETSERRLEDGLGGDTEKVPL
jgi:hypothetical protein